MTATWCQKLKQMFFFNTDIVLPVFRKASSGKWGKVNITYQVTSFDPESNPVTRNMRTASEDVDFESLVGSLVMNEGEMQSFINVTVFDDDVPEIAETFSINLLDAELISTEEYATGKLT